SEVEASSWHRTEWCCLSPILLMDTRMQLQTILNRVERYKSFVYGRVSWDETLGPARLRVEVNPRANGRALCSGCHQKRPGYDRLSPREFEFVPIWGITLLLVYALR